MLGRFMIMLSRRPSESQKSFASPLQLISKEHAPFSSELCVSSRDKLCLHTRRLASRSIRELQISPRRSRMEAIRIWITTGLYQHTGNLQHGKLLVRVQYQGYLMQWSRKSSSDDAADWEGQYCCCRLRLRSR